MLLLFLFVATYAKWYSRVRISACFDTRTTTSIRKEV